MKKEVRNYLSIGFLVLAVLVLAYFLNLGITGFVVFEGGELISPQDDTNYTNATQLVNISTGEDIEVLYNWNGTNVSYKEPHYVEFNEGLNTLTIWINDSEGNVSSIPVTFTIDTAEPEEEFSIIIGSPEEGATYETEEISLNVTTNREVDNWKYVLNDGEDTPFTPNTTITAAEGSNTLIVYANDTEGNVSSESVSFSVLIPSCSSNYLTLCDETNCVDIGDGFWYDYDETCYDKQPVCAADFLELCDETNCVDTGGGYWYGGVCNAQQEETDDTVSEPVITPEASLSASEISTLLLNPGSSQKATLVVTNTGTKHLISCKVRPMGEFDSWILVSEEATNINIGKQHEFSFDVTVPEETEEGIYSLKVSIGCSEIFATRDFTVDVVKKKLEFEVISADRTRDDRVRVLYSLEELSGNDQDVVFTFSLVDANNVEVGRAEVNHSIGANSIDEFKTNININESLLPINETTNETLESELTLNVNFNSQIYSSSIQEKVLIGAPIGGFAIFEGVGAGEAVIFVIVLFVLVFIFIFARRMRRKGKTLKDVVGRAKPANNP